MFSHLIKPPSEPRSHTDPAAPQAVQRFLARVADCAGSQAAWHALLANPRGAGAAEAAPRITVRPVSIRGATQLSFVHRHPTRDVTHNLDRTAGLAEIARLLGAPYANAHLYLDGEELQLAFSRKGKASLRVATGTAQPDSALPASAHNREKVRPLSLQQPWWTDLGVTTAHHTLVPAMARKWKQVNRFVEIFAGAIAAAPGLMDPAHGPLRVADLGAGKAYLTFGVHEHLAGLGRDCEVVGVDIRPDLVRQCETIARQRGLSGLHFEQGDVGTWPARPLDVLIALHACDTATDHAMHRGVQAGAAVILCAPCCHKELRPQMGLPPLFKPMLQHGVHLGQQAEMLTDSLRALLLERAGYDTQVFEFISLEHTQKNKMVLAVRRAGGTPPARQAELTQQINELQAFYGVRQQALAGLLDTQAAEASPQH